MKPAKSIEANHSPLATTQSMGERGKYLYQITLTRETPVARRRQCSHSIALSARRPISTQQSACSTNKKLCEASFTLENECRPSRKSIALSLRRRLSGRINDAETLAVISSRIQKRRPETYRRPRKISPSSSFRRSGDVHQNLLKQMK